VTPWVTRNPRENASDCHPSTDVYILTFSLPPKAFAISSRRWAAPSAIPWKAPPTPLPARLLIVSYMHILSLAKDIQLTTPPQDTDTPEVAEGDGMDEIPDSDDAEQPDGGGEHARTVRHPWRADTPTASNKAKQRRQRYSIYELLDDAPETHSEAKPNETEAHSEGKPENSIVENNGSGGTIPPPPSPLPPAVHH
jgi:hypothetical protein